MDETANGNTGSKKGLMTLLAIIIVLAVAAGAYWYLNRDNAANPTADNNGEEAAAIVNGTEIDRATLERSIEQISGTYAAQGIDTGNEEASGAIREQALTALVNRQLMIDAATKASMTASDEEVEAEYQAALTNIGGEENLTAALSGIGMSVEDLRADIEKDVMINKYLETKLDLDALTVTDEEVKTAYDAAAESNTEEVPPLEDVAELIKNQLLLEKQQKLIADELERLRAEAEIEILV